MASVLIILLLAGVCMKQQKKLTEAISTARNHGKKYFNGSGEGFGFASLRANA